MSKQNTFLLSFILPKQEDRKAVENACLSGLIRFDGRVSGIASKTKKDGTANKAAASFSPTWTLCVCLFLVHVTSGLNICAEPGSLPDRQISGWPLSRSVCFCVHRHLLIFDSVLAGSRRGGRAALWKGRCGNWELYFHSGQLFLVCFPFHARPNDNRMKVSGLCCHYNSFTAQKSSSALVLGRADINWSR